MRFISDWINQATSAINGKIEFGTNILSQTVTVNFTSANTDTLVLHQLGKTGVLYFPVSKNVTCDIYTGATAATASGIYLRSTAATNVTLVLF